MIGPDASSSAKARARWLRSDKHPWSLSPINIPPAIAISLIGRAKIVEDDAEMRSLWPSELDKHFPPGFADANMIVIRVDVDRIEVHVRGLTPEPFGAGRTLLERQSTGGWRFIPAW
jgi:hypothetical protein